jgi:hypothetical protein
MRIIFHLGILFGIVGAVFWADVAAFLKLSAATQERSVPRESIEVPPPPDRREEARREFERLRRENLAAAEQEAHYRSSQNAAADYADEVDRQRERREKSSGSGSSRVSVYSRSGPRPGWGR